MAYDSGYCPQCGVKFNARESSIGTVRRCQNCGHKFILERAPFSITGCVSLVAALLAAGIGLAFGCFTVLMSFIDSASTAPRPPPRIAIEEPAATPIPEPTPEPAVKAQRPAPEPVEMRKWSDRSEKFTTEAQFGGMIGNTVTLHKPDGATVKLPLDQLSDADKEWIAERRKGH